MNSEHERWLVVGSNSFSGSHLVDELLAAGCKVMGISRSEPPSRVFLPFMENASVNKSFEFTKVDLNKDHSLLEKTLNEFQPEYVVNFAAQGMVAQSWENPADWYETNLVSMVRLHDLLRKIQCLKRYIHISTPEVYGHCDGAVSESQNHNPSTPYAVSRAACEMSLGIYKLSHKFPVIFTRAANVFGPGQQLYRIVPRAFLAARTGVKLQLHGGGSSTRSFIHIRDVVRGTIQAARNGTVGDAYHFSCPEVISIRSLVLKICRLAGVNFEQVVEDSPDRLGKDQSYWLKYDKARLELGWEPTIAMEDGLAETLAWVDRNLDEFITLTWEYEHKA